MPPSPLGRQVGFEQIKRVVPSFPRMDDDRPPCNTGDLHLPNKDFVLYFPRRVVVVIVEADFTYGYDLLSRAQRRQAIKCCRLRLAGVVRMDAHCGVYFRKKRRQSHGRFQIRRTLAGTDRQQPLDPGLARPRDHCLAVFVKARIVEMAMRVNDHERRAPTGASSGKPTNEGLPPSSVAATIMPFDSTPRILRGLRLATIATLRPINDSGS